MELKCILCPLFGYKFAIEKVEKALKSFNVSTENRLRNLAVKYKCQYLISIADCYSMALAELEQIPLLMKKESEIEQVINDPNCTIQIIFLSQL